MCCTAEQPTRLCHTHDSTARSSVKKPSRSVTEPRFHHEQQSLNLTLTHQRPAVAPQSWEQHSTPGTRRRERGKRGWAGFNPELPAGIASAGPYRPRPAARGSWPCPSRPPLPPSPSAAAAAGTPPSPPRFSGVQNRAVRFARGQRLRAAAITQTRGTVRVSKQR